MSSQNVKAKRKNSITYLGSGVNIAAGNKLVNLIKPFAKATSRPGADGKLGGFGGIFDLKQAKYKDPILVSGTDGVGTKLKLAFALNKHDTIGIDLVAMCVNDIVVQGAEPLFFLDYLATSKLDTKVSKQVIKGIAKGCTLAECALIGGETAEMPGIYKSGEYDLAGFAVGAVERRKILPKNNIKPGDIIIGMHSDGVHSNGFSLIHYLVKKNLLKFSEKPAFNKAKSKYSGTISGKGKTLGDLLLKPTKIYVKTCLSLLQQTGIKAFAHITGGGLTENVPRSLPQNMSAEIDIISWKLPKLFQIIMRSGGIKATEMLRTFNCGIGMTVVINRSQLGQVTQILKQHKQKFDVIGKIVKSQGKPGTVFLNIDKFGK